MYNVESKSIVQEFIMDDNYPWVNQLSSSPIEPIFVCAGSGNKIHPGSNSKSGALVAWSMKTMSACVSVILDCIFVWINNVFCIGHVSNG